MARSGAPVAMDRLAPKRSATLRARQRRLTAPEIDDVEPAWRSPLNARLARCTTLGSRAVCAWPRGDSGHSHQQIILLFDDTIYIPIWGKTVQLSDRIGRRMKLQDLHVLMTVVQAGSMGKAARHLNTSQPNISKSI